MRRPLRFVSLVPVLALAGCAAGSYCEGEQDYQYAVSIPALQPADGLHIQEASSALKVPPPSENTVPYGETYRDEDGDDAVRCLDQPPELPVSAAQKAEPPKLDEKAAPSEPERETMPAWPG